jgi:uncharacterized membrane protein
MTSRISTTFLVTLMMAFCLSLAYFVFSSQSLRLDEAQSLWQVDRSPGQIFNIIGKDVHVPLYHLTLHFWQQFFGNTVETGRLMSLLLYLASIPAIYFVGKLAIQPQRRTFCGAPSCYISVYELVRERDPHVYPLYICHYSQSILFYKGI